MDVPWDDAPEESLEPARRRILLVDDEAVVLDVLQRLLSREQDLEVTCVETAEAALPLLRDGSFDVLVTDKNLPGMGGVELIAEARGSRAELEAILITGYASAESFISAMAAGASDYLLKPFDDLKTVRAKVRNALEKRKGASRERHQAMQIAREASRLLKEGRDAPEHIWEKLEGKLKEYEAIHAQGASGLVVVVGSTDSIRVLESAGVPAQRAPSYSPHLRLAQVVVIECSDEHDWRDLADSLRETGPDVLLLATPSSDLPELLEAVSLDLDLVGFGGDAPARALPERVRAVLLKRALARAQDELSEVLTEFQRHLS